MRERQRAARFEIILNVDETQCVYELADRYHVEPGVIFIAALYGEFVEEFAPDPMDSELDAYSIFQQRSMTLWLPRSYTNAQ